MPRALRLTFLCHGMTKAPKVAGFPADEPLADGELSRVAVVAALLGRADQAISSPALAALKTSEAIAQNFDVDHTLRDINHGRWTGQSLASIQAQEPENLAEWMANPDRAPHGGESLTDLLTRISVWMDANLQGEGHRIIVTHPAVIRAAIIAVLDAPAAAYWKMDVEHLSITDIRSDGRRWALRSFGRLLQR